MRSIRLSLILCFLLLLVMSLGAVSYVVYRTAERSLGEKNQSLLEQYRTKRDQRIKIEREKLDQALLADARILARDVRVRIQFPDWRLRRLASLGILTSAATTQGHLQYPLWIAQSSRNVLSFRLYWMRVAPKLKELTLPPDQKVADFQQINLVSGDEWKSQSLRDLEASFAFSPRIFEESQLVDWNFDTVELEKGKKVRRVQLKVSQFPVSMPRPGRSPYTRKSSGPKPRIDNKESIPTPPLPSKSDAPKTNKGNDGPIAPPPPSRKRSGRSGSKSRRSSSFDQTIYVQAAANTEDLNAIIAGLEREYQNDLANLADDSKKSVEQLHNNLLAINGGTLVAAVLLACLLVHWGLSPLRRMSDAVSQVSERDFRLRLERKNLPGELKPIADRIHQTLDLLKRAFAREKQAAADISHELRTPLAAVMTTLELGLRKERSPEEYRELLEECRSAGQQMSQLVERLLALARLDAGADHLRFQEVDVARLADQCAELVRPLAEARNLALTVQANGPAAIKADPDKLREVLTNLLHNAIEYNKADGSIQVAVKRDNGRLHVQVQDTGIGIPTESTEHIFERFFRQDSARGAEGMHAGIGLALVKGYVDLMGGVVTVDSTIGQGSTFHVDLPVKNNAESEF